jgi:hypothetical protein
MLNTRLVYILFLMPLLMTTVPLAVPIQTQGQPTSSEDTCFPVEPGAATLKCTEGAAESGGQEANSTP